MEIRVLVADDDDAMRDLVCDIIENEGFRPVEAKDGNEAIGLFYESGPFDLVILDIMMPGADGWTVLKALRSDSEVPVMMLTALGDEEHEVQGLRLGADEYIPKPFSYEVFRARVHKLLKKALQQKTQKLVVGSLEIDPRCQEVSLDGELLSLNRKEYQLLSFFIQNPRQVFTREQLIVALWGYDFEGDDRTVDTHIKMLRSKLGACSSYIKTVRGTGYIFEGAES